MISVSNNQAITEMQLDLRKAARLIRKQITQRVRDYPLYINEGPGRDEASIQQITIGYQFDQSGWLAIIFDTRPQAKNDGEWNSYIEPNAIEFDEWHRAFSDLVENGSPINLILPDGTKRKLGKGTTVEQVAESIGITIRDALLQARDNGVFAGLPLAPNCSYVVEEHEGYFGWSDQVEAGPQSEQAYLDHLEGDVATKSEAGQVEHWVKVLERIASGKENESKWSFLASDHTIEQLEALGDQAIVPVLKFVRKWADQPEWEGDRPKRKLIELPMQRPTIDALMLVRNSSCRTPEVEKLLCQILQKSVQANSDRKLWGIMPLWTARCLSKLFDHYPELKQNESTNELVNRDEYLSKPSKKSQGD